MSYCLGRVLFDKKEGRFDEDVTGSVCFENKMARTGTRQNGGRLSREGERKKVLSVVFLLFSLTS